MATKVYVLYETMQPYTIISVFNSEELANKCRDIANKKNPSFDYEVIDFELITELNQFLKLK